MEQKVARGSREGELAFYRTLVEAGGLSAAAIALSCSASSVSKQLGALERRLGIQLIKRNAHCFSLTAAGRYYYEQAVQLTTRLETAERHLQNLADAPMGQLTVGIAEGLFETVLLEPVCEFLGAYPDISIALINTGHGGRLSDAGHDCQILRIDLDEVADNAARVELMSSRLTLCASREFLARHGEPASPRELSSYACLVAVNKTGRLLNNWRFKRGRERVSITVAPRFAGLGRQVHQMAMRGMGIARIPDHLLATEAGTTGLARVLPEWEDPERRTVSLLYSGEETQPQRVKLFARFLQQFFSAPGPEEQERGAG